MKNKSKFAIELIITIVVAGILSSIIGFIAIFITANLGVLDQSHSAISSTVGIVFGSIVGYKLNSLIRSHSRK